MTRAFFAVAIRRLSFFMVFGRLLGAAIMVIPAILATAMVPKAAWSTGLWFRGTRKLLFIFGRRANLGRRRRQGDKVGIVTPRVVKYTRGFLGRRNCTGKELRAAATSRVKIDKALHVPRGQAKLQENTGARVRCERRKW